MSLASHFLRDLTFSRLCSALSVREHTSGPEYRGNSRLKQMLKDETIMRLAPLLKDFRIYGFSRDAKLQGRWMKLCIKGLSTMTSLQSVGLWDIFLHTEIVDALASLPILQSLKVINCRTGHYSEQNFAFPMFKSLVALPLEASFRELRKVTVLHSDFALVKSRISPDSLQEIAYGTYESWSLLPYPAPALSQLRRLSVSVVDLKAFFRDLSSVHGLTELVIRQVWLPDRHSLRNLPKPGNRSQPILSKLSSLACPVFLLRYFAGCPLETLDLTLAYNGYGTQFPSIANDVDLPIPIFPSLHALVIPHPLFLELALPLGENFPQLRALDLQFRAHRNFLPTLQETVVHLCIISPLPHLETLLMRHLAGMNQLNLVEQRNLLDNPIKNAFPSLTKGSFFEAVDWYWSHEEKNWTPFIPVDERQYAARREYEWVDYKGYLESIVRPSPVTVREQKALMVSVMSHSEN
jgi:hypothetical protein